MSKGVKLLAALMEDDTSGGNHLMGAARTLAGAVSDLLKAVEPASGEVGITWLGIHLVRESPGGHLVKESPGGHLVNESAGGHLVNESPVNH